MSTKDPEGNGTDKRGEFLLIQVFVEKKEMRRKIEPDWIIALESSLVGTGPEAPGQLCLLSRR